MRRRWEKFSAAVSAADKRGQAGVVAELFPFSEYFADAPQPLFKEGASCEEDMEVGCAALLPEVGGLQQSVFEGVSRVRQATAMRRAGRSASGARLVCYCFPCQILCSST